MPLTDGFKERGLCRKFDPELWWPNGTTGEEAVKTEAAVSICHRCPVELECHMWAVAQRQYFGIWGGTTEEQRRDDRRRHRRIMEQQVDRTEQVSVVS